MFGRQRVSSETVGEPKWSWRATLKKHVQEMRERIWISPEMQTTLLNMYHPTLMETILKALRKPFNEDDQMDAGEETAGCTRNLA